MPPVRIGGPCEQTGAYITDGTRLYQVLDVQQHQTPLRPPETRVVLEDVSTGKVHELEAWAVEKRMRVVIPEDSDQLNPGGSP